MRRHLVACGGYPSVRSSTRRWRRRPCSATWCVRLSAARGDVGGAGRHRRRRSRGAHPGASPAHRRGCRCCVYRRRLPGRRRGRAAQPRRRWSGDRRPRPATAGARCSPPSPPASCCATAVARSATAREIAMRLPAALAGWLATLVLPGQYPLVCWAGISVRRLRLRDLAARVARAADRAAAAARAGRRSAALVTVLVVAGLRDARTCCSRPTTTPPAGWRRRWPR